MAITRRQFLKRTGLATAGGMLGPGLLGNPFIRKALADTIGDRYFVVVYLDGGNDGLNTVIPYDNGNGGLRSKYTDPQTGRRAGGGGLQIATSSLDGTGNNTDTVLGAIGSNPGTDPNTHCTLALHPGYIGLKNLYDLGKVAVVQGCGYPSYNLSHEQSRHIWQKGDPFASLGSGWLGRYLAANYAGTDIPGVNINDRIYGEFEQSATSVLALNRLVDFGFPYQDYNSDNPFQKDALLDLFTAATGGTKPALVQFVGNSGIATVDASDTYPLLDGEYTSARQSFDDQYSALDSGFANDIREVAKVIWGVTKLPDPQNPHPNVKSRFFEVSNGGYDTHSDQGGATGQQYDLHRTVGDALEVFYHDCEDMGVSDKLCIMIWSEFSRRPQQNASGTDHGSQGPVFVIGGNVKGGVYGNHPNIDPAALNPDDGNTMYSQDGGNGFRSTDFRDVYGTILERWLGMSHSTILSTVLSLDGGSLNDYWTAENFNLGFLP